MNEIVLDGNVALAKAKGVMDPHVLTLIGADQHTFAIAAAALQRNIAIALVEESMRAASAGIEEVIREQMDTVASLRR